jgi:tetratricopeptide (TPR) repeat protein
MNTAAAVALIAGGVSYSVGQDRVSSSPETSAARTSPPIVVLQRRPIPYDVELQLAGQQLAREIGRQTLLMTAREDFGYNTRDAVLEEAGPTTDCLELDFESIASMKDKVYVYVNRTDAPDDRWEGKYFIVVKGRKLYDSFLETLFKKDMLRTPLELYGMTPVDHPSREMEFDGEKTEALLQEMNIIAQFQVARSMHQQIRFAGETPERLAILVRSYANLGVLTRGMRNAASEAFAARAIVYATRLRTKYPSADHQSYVVSYAYALAGLHHLALATLEATEKIESSQSADAPMWARTIVPVCRYDTERLMELGQKNWTVAPLVNCLAFQSLRAANDTRQLWNQLQQSLKLSPMDTSMMSPLTYERPLGIKRTVASAGLRAASYHIPRRLAKVLDLPPNVKDVLRAHAKELHNLKGFEAGVAGLIATSRLAQTLTESSESLDPLDEPSWAMLGGLLQQMVTDRITEYLEVGTDGTYEPQTRFVEAVLPAIRGHRYENYIRSFGVNAEQSPQEWLSLVRDLEYLDPRPAMLPMILRLYRVPNTQGEQPGLVAYYRATQRDFTADGLLGMVRSRDVESLEDEIAAYVLKELQSISPHNPAITELDALLTKDPTPDQIKQWTEREYRSARALRIVAAKAQQIGDRTNEITCLERAQAISPTADGAIRLARAYYAIGEQDKWLPTAKSYLEVEDFGIGHSVVASHIANELMNRKSWDEAEEFIETAASSYSFTGLETALRYCAHTGKPEEILAVAQALSEAYRGRGRCAWFLWCKVLGAEPQATAAARELALRYVEQPGTDINSQARYTIAAFWYLDGNRQRALDELMVICRERQEIYHLCVAVLWADALKDAKTLDEILQLFEHSDHLKDDTDAPDYEFAQLSRELTQRVFRDGHKVTSNDVDRLAGAIKVGGASSFNYAAGLWYAKAGNLPKAIQQWDELAEGPLPHIPQALLSVAEKKGRTRQEGD